MKTAFLLKATCLLAALLLAAGGALAQQYKWKDKSGRVQYGDTPPPGVNATTVGAPSTPTPQPPAPSAAADKKGPGDPEAGFRKRQEEAAKDRQKQAEAAQTDEAKKDNCARAQRNLRTLESGQRISQTDAKGERYYLDEAQIEQEKARARKLVQDWCN